MKLYNYRVKYLEPWVLNEVGEFPFYGDQEKFDEYVFKKCAVKVLEGLSGKEISKIFKLEKTSELVSPAVISEPGLPVLELTYKVSIEIDE